MVSDTASLVAFIIVAAVICGVFAIVVIRALKGKGCSCGKEKSSCTCCHEHCSFRTDKSSDTDKNRCRCEGGCGRGK